MITIGGALVGTPHKCGIYACPKTSASSYARTIIVTVLIILIFNYS